MFFFLAVYGVVFFCLGLGVGRVVFVCVCFVGVWLLEVWVVGLCLVGLFLVCSECM